jgi:threonine dehydratase
MLAAAVLGPSVFVKAECLQVTGSFKVRGGLAALDATAKNAPGRAIVTCSAGNHGLGIACASSVLGIEATVVVPTTASLVKVAKLRALGATLVEHGADYGEAERYALELAENCGAAFISPYNDTAVIAGQATLATEILEQLPDVSRVICPIGGGGLASGLVLGFSGCDVTVVGVQPEENAAMAALLAGTPESFVDGHTVADGLAGGVEPGAVTAAILGEAGIEVVTVSEDAIARAVAEIFATLGLIVEGSAAVTWAGIRSGLVAAPPGTVVLLTGSNITPLLFAQLLRRAQASSAGG